MSFSVTFFGPSHFWWKWKNALYPESGMPRAWFYRPDEYSTGGIGFCIPGLHMVFNWGRKKKPVQHP